VVDANGMVVCPGFIDLHCHLRDPGFEEKETIATGARAAAHGGFTTICCMPNTNPPADASAAIEYIKNKAQAEGVVRVFPIGCITQGREGKKLAEMGRLAESGVVGYSDDGSPVADAHLMRNALQYSKLFNLPIIDHCEDVSLTAAGVMNEGLLSSELGLAGTPAAAESIMVARDIALVELTGGRLHLAHVSTAASVDIVRRAKERKLSVTAEVAPHHLTLTEECVVNYNTNAKVNPPLRTKADIEALIAALNDGTLDAIATDHAPHTLADKQCEFALAAFGISGFETALGSLMSLVHNRELDLVTLISKLTIEPANILIKGGQDAPIAYDARVPWGLGTLKVGAPADIVIIDTEAEWIVDPQEFASKGRNTPWEDCSLKGQVMLTVAEGEIVYKHGHIEVGKPTNG